MKPNSDTRAAQRCPDCDAAISARDINIGEGIALCPSCGSPRRLSELKLDSRSIEEILARLPSGCTIAAEGQSVRVVASLRSLVGFLAPFCFGLFWNGILSVFVLIAATALYFNLVGPLPPWFPALGVKNGVPMMNDEPMGLGSTLGICLFLTPFVIIGAGTWLVALMNLIGRVEVVVGEFGSYVATGVGFLRWKHRFEARDVVAVTYQLATGREDADRKQQIQISADRPIKFGSMLREDRIAWLHAVLHELLLGSKDSRGLTDLPPLAWLPRRN